MTRLEITTWGYSKNNPKAVHNIHVLFCMASISGLKPSKAGMAYARPGISRRFSEFRRFLVRPRSGCPPRVHDIAV
ncbi:hypothetical protein DYB36_013177 [Aphanomyces astaci]|uniref:Uncharacterized protein n=1 Tax=Aphanomyces astaci TaxID=112090 RepID=A0A396ZVS8_APHAT|nr:hypothetical protein DYB36_013177 [Aphanomyces astaci]